MNKKQIWQKVHYLKDKKGFFDDYLQRYYFISEQIITNSNDIQKLGQKVELNITLQPYDYASTREWIKETLFL